MVQQLRGRNASIGDCLGRGFSVLLPVLGVALLQALIIFVGFILCVIPGIVLSVQLAVAVPAAVEERPGVIGALRRSRDLTRGNGWPVFCVLFVLGLLGYALGYVMARALGPGALASYGQYVQFGLQIVTTALSATAGAVMYYRLRSSKESVDLENLASVFD